MRPERVRSAANVVIMIGEPGACERVPAASDDWICALPRVAGYVLSSWLGRSWNSSTSPRVAAVGGSDFEFPAGAGAEWVMETAARLDIEPETWRPPGRVSARPGRSFRREECVAEVRVFPAQTLPVVLAAFVEVASKWREGNRQAARAASVAGLDDWQISVHW